LRVAAWPKDSVKLIAQDAALASEPQSGTTSSTIRDDFLELACAYREVKDGMVRALDSFWRSVSRGYGSGQTVVRWYHGQN